MKTHNQSKHDYFLLKRKQFFHGINSKLIFLLPFFYVFSFNILAQNVSHQATADTLTFSGRIAQNCAEGISIFKDTNALNIEQIGLPSFQSNFKKYTDDEYLEKGGDYWMRITFKNEYNPYEVQDRFYFSFLRLSDTIEVFIRDIKKEKYIMRQGALRGISEDIKRNGLYFLLRNYSLVEMPILESEYLTYFIKIESKNKIKIGRLKKRINATNLEQLQKGFKNTFVQELIYVGFLLMIFIYSIGLFSFMRESAFFYYSLFCLSMLVYTSHSFDVVDFVLSYFPSIPIYHYDLAFLSIYIVLFSFLFFVLSYLELYKHYSTWNKIFKSLGYLSLALMILEIYYHYFDGVFLGNWLEDYFRNLIYLLIINVIAILIFMVPLWKMKTKKKYFLFFGIVSLLIGVIFLIFKYFTTGTILQSDYLIYVYFSGGEIILFGLGLAYRIKENEIDKQQAMLQLQKVENEKRINELEKKNLLEINLQDLPKGFYVLKIEGKDKIISKKIIKE